MIVNILENSVFYCSGRVYGGFHKEISRNPRFWWVLHRLRWNRCGQSPWRGASQVHRVCQSLFIVNNTASNTNLSLNCCRGCFFRFVQLLCFLFVKRSKLYKQPLRFCHITRRVDIFINSKWHFYQNYILVSMIIRPFFSRYQLNKLYSLKLFQIYFSQVLRSCFLRNVRKT